MAPIKFGLALCWNNYNPSDENANKQKSNKPDPILMRPLCWMKIVSQDKFPWTMGVSQPWR